MGKQKLYEVTFDMKSTVLLTTLNPLLSALLVQRYGAAGAAAGTAIALISAEVYLLLLFHRHYLENSPWTAFSEIQLRPALAGILAAFAIVGLHGAVPVIGQLDGVRYLIPVKMTIDLGIFSVIYVVLLIALRQVTVIDWRNLTGLISFGTEFLRHPFRQRVKIYR